MSGRAAPRLNSLRVCTLRAQTLRSSSIRESELVRVARYALKRSRSHAGPPARPSQAPSLYARPSPPARGLAGRSAWSGRTKRRPPCCTQSSIEAPHGRSVLAEQSACAASSSAVFGRPRRCAVRARMKGWRLEGRSRRRSAATRAPWRVSSRAYVSGSRNMFESGVCVRACKLQTSCFAGVAGTCLPGLPARLRAGRRTSGPAPHTDWGDGARQPPDECSRLTNEEALC
jgi:hypothetical protein